MKRMRTAVIAAVLLGVLAVGAAAASGIQQILVDLRPDITVEVDGMARTMTDKNGKTVYPISYDGTTYLPVRALGEILGQTVEWDSATQTVIMTEKVLEPAALYPTVDDLEKGMTRSEKAIDGLTPADTYVERAKQYSEISELTPELLRLFIEKIVVGERAEKYSHSAPQEVTIYYRDIGLLDTTEEQDLQNELSNTGPAA